MDLLHHWPNPPDILSGTHHSIIPSQGGLSLMGFCLGGQKFRHYPGQRRLSLSFLEGCNLGKLLSIGLAGAQPPRSHNPSIRSAGLFLVPRHAPMGPNLVIAALTLPSGRCRGGNCDSCGIMGQGVVNPAPHMQCSTPIGALKVPMRGWQGSPFLDTSPAVGLRGGLH